MKKTKKRALYIFAALLAALFVLSCLVGFAACGGGDDNPEDDTPAGATVSSVSVTPTSLDLFEGGSGSLSATVTMSDGSNYGGSYTWSSSAESIAKVTGNGATGTVTAVKEGSATITVAVSDNKSASCAVAVTAVAAASITLDQSELDLDLSTGSTTTSGTLTATVTMNDGSTPVSPTWSSSDESVATVENGVVTAVGNGTATITATAGSVSATCTVYVAGPASLELSGSDAALMNAKGATKSSGASTLMAVDATSGVITNIGAGDLVVYQILASNAPAEGVEATVTVSVPSDATLSDIELYVESEDSQETPADTPDSTALSNGSATVTIVDGVNYVVLTAASTATSASLSGVTLDWNQGKVTITSSSIFGGTTTSTSYGPSIELVETSSQVFEIGADAGVTIEAESATLFNAVGVTGSTNLLGTEQTTLNDKTVITNVKNFNTIGDSIVFQVNASQALTDMPIEITAGNAALMGGTFADNDKILTVNGTAVGLSGALTNGAFDYKSYGTLTGTISLDAGINYIVITAATTAGTGYLNVDKIDLDGGAGAAVVSTADALTQALTTGGTVVLSGDITASSVSSGATADFTVSADTTIDLDGKTISTDTSLTTAVNTIEVEAGATLTIKDSAGTGSIKNTYTGATSTDNAAAIEVEEGGSLVLNGGTITSTSIGVKAEGVDSDVENTRATVEINGGEISSTYFSIFASGDVDVTINGGTISGTSKGICIDGDSNFGYSNYNYGTTTTLTVTGGEISCTNDSAICTLGGADASSAVITISGGEISNSASVTGTGTSITAPPAVYVPNGTLTITGGTITSTLTAVEIRGGTAKISGGTLITTYSGEEPGDDATQSTFGAKTYGYALSVYAYGVNSTIDKRLQNSSDNYTNDVNVTVTGGTFVGDIYVAAEAEYSVNNEAKWQVKLNDSSATTTDKYVVTMSGIEFVGYTSNGNEAGTDGTVAYYLWTSRISAVTADDDRLTVETNLAFDASDITVAYDLTTNTYTISGTSSTMGQDLAKAVYGESHKDCEYITFEVVANAGETVTISSYNGETCDGTWTLYGTETDGTSTTDGLFVLDLTNHNEGAWKMVIEVSDGTTTYTYTVVRGTIAPSSASSEDPV